MNEKPNLTKSILHLQENLSAKSSTIEFVQDEQLFVIAKRLIDETLDSINPNTLDAVIVESQNQENLQKVVDFFEKNDIQIPLFIIKLEKALKIISKKTNIIDKTNTEPALLYRDVSKHLLENNLLEKAASKNEVMSQKPAILEFIDGDQNRVLFAFKLNSLLGNNQQKLSEWNESVLNSLLFSFDNLVINRLIINENGKVSVYYTFEIVSELFEKLYAVIAYYFNNDNLQNPVLFATVNKLQILKRLQEKLALKYQKGNMLFYPETIALPSFHKINGYTTSQPAETTNSIAIPVFKTAGNNNFNEIFDLFQTTPDNCLITEISSVILSNEQKDEFLQAAKMLQNGTLQISGQESKIQLAYWNQLAKKDKVYRVVHSLATNSPLQSLITQKLGQILFDNKTQPAVINDKPELPVLSFLYLPQEYDAIGFVPEITRKISSGYDVIYQQENDILPVFFDSKGVKIGQHYKGAVYLDEKQFKKHTYVIGKTGMGKTSILYAMIMDRIHKGQGVALIDPHGDLYKLVQKNIPDHRKKDLVVFNPTDPANNFGFNMLHYNREFPEQQGFVIGELMQIMDELYDMKHVGGPMFELFFTNVMKLVMYVEGEKATLLDFERFFYGKGYKEHVLRRSPRLVRSNSIVSNLLKQQGEQSFENFAPYITSKISRLIENDYIRNTTCNPNKNFDFRSMMDNNKILLVSLNKGRLGSEAVQFLGRILTNQIVLAAYTRENIPESQRRDFSLFIDEFQNFTSTNITTALGETRKYRLQLILANQNFEQLNEAVINTILANVGSIISGAISPKDAERMIPFFEPFFTKENMVQLDSYKFMVATQTGSRYVQPFIISSIPYHKAG